MTDVVALLLGGVMVYLYFRSGYSTSANAGGSGAGNSNTSGSTAGNFVPVPTGVPTTLPATPVVLSVAPANPQSAGLVNVPPSPAVQAPIGPTLAPTQTITHVMNSNGMVVPVAAAAGIPGPEDPGTLVVQGGTLQYIYSYVKALPMFDPNEKLPAGDWAADVHGAALDLPAYNPALFGLDPATPVTFDQFFQLASQYYAQHPSPTAFLPTNNLNGLGARPQHVPERSVFAV